eukprot:m.241598 g.241598  ORF g.241598 m.241598 type:complete len:52 (+) comp15327_c0_seq6:1543-1698(+)
MCSQSSIHEMHPGKQEQQKRSNSYSSTSQVAAASIHQSRVPFASSNCPEDA